MEFSLTDAEFKTFKDFIYDKSGIFFSEINRAILENRLFEIMLKYQYRSIMDYYEKLKSDPVEVRNFLDLITTNLTKFFRNQPQFEALERKYYPISLKEMNFLEPSRSGQQVVPPEKKLIP